MGIGAVCLEEESPSKRTTTYSLFYRAAFLFLGHSLDSESCIHKDLGQYIEHGYRYG